jgi:hypothetical protein
MRVPYSEGLASHTGPEPHGGCGNTIAAAWEGGSAGGALSSEITSLRCRPCCLVGKAILTAALYASCGRTWRSLSTLACVDTSCARIERSGKPPSFRAGIGESSRKNLLMHRGWLCSDGNDEQEKQSANGGWAGEGEMPYVQPIKLLGSRTQHSTEEAGEQEEISTSAESVEGRT